MRKRNDQMFNAWPGFRARFAENLELSLPPESLHHTLKKLKPKPNCLLTSIQRPFLFFLCD